MDKIEGGIVVTNGNESSLVFEEKENKDQDPIFLYLEANVDKKRVVASEHWGDGALKYQGRLSVPRVNGLYKRNLEEAQISRYSIHLGSTKMYHDFIEVYL